MMPPAGAVLRLAQELEAIAHKEGWDRPATLGYVVGVKGEAVGSLPLPVPLQPATLHPDAARGLRLIADSMLIGAKPFAGFVELPPGLAPDFAGAWFIYEGWGVAPLAPRGQSIADTPGAMEVRAVMVVDCAGRVTSVARVRGQEPKSAQMKRGDAQWDRIAGPVWESLRDIVLAVGMKLPLGTVDLDAVRAVASAPAPNGE